MRIPRRPLLPGGRAALRRRLAPPPTRRPAGAYVRTVPSGTAPAAKPEEPAWAELEHQDVSRAHLLEGTRGRKRLDVLSHVVDTEDRRAALVGEDGDGHSGGNGPRQRLLVTEQPSEKALAGSADQHRPSERHDLVQARE